MARRAAVARTGTTSTAVAGDVRRRRPHSPQAGSSGIAPAIVYATRPSVCASVKFCVGPGYVASAVSAASIDAARSSARYAVMGERVSVSGAHCTAWRMIPVASRTKPWRVLRYVVFARNAETSLNVSCRSCASTAWNPPGIDGPRRRERFGIDARTTASAFVAPHASRSLWPRITPGTPAIGRAGNVFAGRVDVDQMPDSRNAPHQVRIVGQQRVARRRARRARRPLVAAEHVVHVLAVPRDRRRARARRRARGSGGSLTGLPPAVGTS